VGCKLDLRNNRETTESLSRQKLALVTIEEGEQLAKNIKASTYVECSALTMEGLRNVFDEVRNFHSFFMEADPL
jgi:cell division control protein 42